jgi:hypothetical protein
MFGKKIIVLFIIIITIINVITLSFIFIYFQTMKMPETTVKMEILEINSKEMVINSVIDIKNSNNFDITVEKLNLITKTSYGSEIGCLRIEGGKIPSNKNKIFTKKYTATFNGESPDEFVTTLEGIIGMSVVFIEKKLPISVNIISVINDLIDNFKTPTANINIDFGEITQKNISLLINVDFQNPNTFDVKLEDVTINILNQNNESVGDIKLSGVLLTADNYTNIWGEGLILIEALNAQILKINLSSMATAIIAGYNKTLPINIESTINSPDLNELLPSNLPTDAVLRGDYRATLFGFKSEIILQSINPNNIEYAAKDITITVARIDKKQRRVVATGEIEDGIIKANNTTLFKGELTIPYRKIFTPALGGKIIPDWLEITIRANITIKGLENYVWVGMVGYTDFRLFRKDVVYSDPVTVKWN